ncbi:PTS system IIB component, L-Asc family [Clostridium pasteurianum DSM 525 = ATCC 6013]|uniref:PTS system IIB component, L-Asc family n=1 Tax=Clostridium pasteurianum DSM 525 = ATCC 6013 TaxID=1262449 RepID=A0A0H3J7F3_CLOPA|nr:PTS sugar transporter subunit IIB [Clostridium pasteurianum]AJA46920.1 PTS system IIB component, L-Asc family [Clostridium pasteurianum DSM 525 = ATCC 6013]AJA50908.1 PTS system IIB component, L-Asc family [Clostridium pasteurianum DSM 525 = ATCC 6013]AOZ74304.1 PTS ascorbate transporter subunit IIB [Clostridium pasteurianum DSM 525 = ATCC 6013]AOZ78102.1 PTS ascorbate transporter subunit IIB [Clostridium pasteurianum]ELP58170.1 PTS system enzyme IIB component [Clostridium pasteurianum DSM 
MLRVIAACGSGMGSSQIIKMKINKVFKKLNIPVTVQHNSVGEAKSQASNFDVVFCSEVLKSNFKRAEDSGTIIIGLKNILSEKEIEEKVIEKIVNKN